MISLFSRISLIIILLIDLTSAQTLDSLRKQIEKIISTKNATVGVSILGYNGNDTISFNGSKHFPLQSVFKFHIALVVLSQIDEGKFSLDEKIEISKKELLPDLWSPLREENPNGGSFSVSKLIEYSVALSDNVGCDALLRMIGGPKVVDEYFIKNGIKDISIILNEEQQQADWNLQFQNWTTPIAANSTLSKFYFNKDKLLSRKNYNFIWQVMKETETGQNRLKAQLPLGTIVAHKTGSSGVNSVGITAAVNDIGIVFLPNGKYFFISVFVTDSRENSETNDKIIADIAKVAWDYFSTRIK